MCKVGDTVRIIECPPISKRKTWTVVSRNGELLVDETLDDTAVAAVAAHEAAPVPAAHAPTQHTGG